MVLFQPDDFFLHHDLFILILHQSVFVLFQFLFTCNHVSLFNVNILPQHLNLLLRINYFPLELLRNISIASQFLVLRPKVVYFRGQILGLPVLLSSKLNLLIALFFLQFFHKSSQTVHLEPQITVLVLKQLPSATTSLHFLASHSIGAHLSLEVTPLNFDPHQITFHPLTLPLFGLQLALQVPDFIICLV